MANELLKLRLSDRVRNRPRHRQVSPRRFFRPLGEPLENRHLLASVLWDAGGDASSWHDPANWSTDTVPNSADDVFIPDVARTSPVIFSATSGSRSVRNLVTHETVSITGGQLEVKESAEFLAGMFLSGGTLTGSGLVKLFGDSTWSVGVMNGSGSTLVVTGSTLNLTSSSTKQLGGGRLLENDGIVRWSAGPFSNIANESASILNDGHWSVEGDVVFQSSGSGTKSFINRGVYRKTTGEGVHDIHWEFENTTNSLFDVDAGSATFFGGGSSGGEFEAAELSKITFDSNFTLNGTHAFANRGAYELVNDQLTLAANITIPTNVHFTQASGVLMGSSTLTVNGFYLWQAGVMTGAGRTVINHAGVLSLTTVNTKLLGGGRTIENDGTVIWIGGALSNATHESAFIVNDREWIVDGDLSLQTSGGGTKSFLNNGTYHKLSGSGAHDIHWEFTNAPSATIQVDVGTLTFYGGGSSGGKFDVAALSTLTFDSNFTLTTGHNFEDHGSYVLVNDQLTLAADITIPQLVHVTQSSGTISGTANLIIDGFYVWQSGVMSSAGKTLVSPMGVLNLTTSGTKSLGGGRTIENEGTVEWIAGAVSNVTNESAFIVNKGEWRVDGDLSLLTSGVGAKSFTNNGIYGKVSGTANHDIHWEFTNALTGAFQVDTGSVIMNGGGSSAGQFIVANNSRLTFDSDFALNAGHSFAASGTYVLVNDKLTIAADLSIPAGMVFEQLSGTLAGTTTITIDGAFDWQSGLMTGTGKTRNAGTMTLRTAGTKLLGGGRTLENDDFLIWSGGTLSNQTNESGFIVNDDEWWTSGELILSTSGDGTKLFTNHGLYLKNGTETHTINWEFTNTLTGAFQVDTGLVTMNGGGSSAGQFIVANNSRLTFDSDFALNAGHSFAASGTYVLVNDKLTFAADLSIPAGMVFEQVSGTLAGTATITIDGAFDWQSGLMTGTGKTRNAGTMTLRTAGAKLLGGGRTLENDDFLVWSGGTLSNQTNESGFIVNDDEWWTSGELILSTSGGGTKSFTNNGLYFMNGTGPNSIHWEFTNSSSGEFQVDSGSATFFGGGSSAGRFEVDTQASLTLDSNFTLNSGHSFSGSGLYELVNDTLTLAADVSMPVDLVFVQTSGTISGDTTLTIHGVFDWHSGLMTGAGKTLVASGAEMGLGTSGIKILGGGRTLENDGITRWDGGALSNATNESAYIVNNNIWMAGGDMPLQSSGGGTHFFTTNGVYTKNGGSGTQNISWEFLNTGKVESQSGILRFDGSYSQQGGSVQLRGGNVSFGSTAAVHEGVLEGSGIIHGNVKAVDSTIAPGGSPGTLTINGNLTVSGESLLDLEVANAVDYDRLVITGSVALAGTMKITLLDPFEPHLSDEFQVLTYAALSGDLSVVESNGVFFERKYSADNLKLVVQQLSQFSIFWDGDSDGDGNGLDWHDPLNWNLHRVPRFDDDVLIDYPGDAIVITNADVSIRSLLSEERLSIGDGVFAVAANSQTKLLSLVDGALRNSAEFVVTDRADWSGGDFAGQGTVVVGSEIGILANYEVMRILPGQEKRILDGELRIEGNAVWGGQAADQIVFADGPLETMPKISVRGTWDFENPALKVLDPTRTGGIVGLGDTNVFRVTPGARMEIETPLAMSRVEVTEGLLYTRAALVGGDYRIGSFGQLQVDAGGSVQSIEGAGKLVVTNGLLEVAGDGTFSVTGETVLQAPALAETELRLPTGATMGELRLESGVVSSGELTVTDLLIWTGGDFTSIGDKPSRIISEGELIIVEELPSFDAINLHQSILVNNGRAEWRSGSLALTGGAEFINSAGAEFEIQSDGVFASQSFEVVDRFLNLGLLKKTGVSDAYMSATLKNDGYVEIEQGELELLVSEPTEHTGRFDVSAGAALAFSDGTHTFASSSSLNGDGKVRLVTDDALLTLRPENVNFERLDVNEGTIQLAGEETILLPELFFHAGSIREVTEDSGPSLKITEGFEWSGGTVSAKMIVEEDAYLQTNTANEKLLEQTLVLAGDGLFDATDFFLSSAGRLVIEGEALFRDDGGIFKPADHDFGVVKNSGTVRKTLTESAPDSSIIEATFINVGSLIVEQGSLTVRNRVGDGQSEYPASDGDFDIRASGTFDLDGPFRLESAGTISGAGDMRFSSGLVELQGSYAVTGTTTITQIAGSPDTVVEFKRDTTVGATQFFAGTLTGQGHITVSGLFEWKGGRITGPDHAQTLTATQGMNIIDGGLAPRVIDHRIVVSTGHSTWTSGNWTIGLDAEFLNGAGGRFDIVSNATLLATATNANGSGPPAGIDANYGFFLNQGTLQKTSDGITSLDAPFLNVNQVRVSDGELRLKNPSHIPAESSGRFDIESNAILSFANGEHQLSQEATVRGSGTVQFLGGETVSRADFQPDHAEIAVSPFGLIDGFLAPTITFESDAGLLDLDIISGAIAVRGANLLVANSVTQDDGFVVLDRGTLIVGDSYDLNNGDLIGNGSVVGSLTNNGVIRPGVHHDEASYRAAGQTGQIQISGGDYVQTTNGSYVVELSGNAPHQYDQLLTSQTKLDGNVVVTYLNGFLPPDDFDYTIVAGSSIDGLFSSINIPEVSAGRTLRPQYSTTTVLLSVASNGLPNTTDDSVVAVAGVPLTLNVLANDSDPDGDSLRIASFTAASRGQVTRNDSGQLVYTPQVTQSGPDEFTYVVTDGLGGTAMGTVRITVQPTGGAPSGSPEDTRQKLDSGFALLENLLPEWGRLFKLDEQHLPSITNDLARLFRLAPDPTSSNNPNAVTREESVLNRVALPRPGAEDLNAPNQVDSFAQLKDLLENLLPSTPGQSAVDCINGGVGNTADCEYVQIRYVEEFSTPDFSSLSQTDAIDSETQLLLDSLNSTLQIDGTLNWNASLRFEIVVGVDENGFYVSDESNIQLRVTGGRESQDPDDAVVESEFIIDLSFGGSGDKLRPEDLSGEPRNYIEQVPSGQAVMHLAELQIGDDPHILTIKNVSLKIGIGTDKGPSPIQISGDSVVLFETDAASESDPCGDSGSHSSRGLAFICDFEATFTTAGRITFAADPLLLDVAGVLDVTVEDAIFDFDPRENNPNAPLATVGKATVRSRHFPELSATLSSLELNRGSVTLSGATLARSGMLEYDDLIELQNPSITINDFEFSFTAGASAGGLVFEADEARLLNNAVMATELAISFDFEPAGFHITADTVHAGLGEFVTLDFTSEPPGGTLAHGTNVVGSGFRMNFNDDPFIFDLDGNITARFPALESSGVTPAVTLTGLGLRRDGTWKVNGASVELPNAYSFPLAEYLPFHVTFLELDFDLNNDDIASFDQFKLLADGHFNIELLRNAFGGNATPVVRIGPIDPAADPWSLTAANNGEVNNVEITLESLRQGKFALEHLDPITLGIRDWEIGPFVFGGLVYFGSYENGQLQPLDLAEFEIDPHVSGFVQLKPDAGNVSPITGNPDVSDFGTSPPAVGNDVFGFNGGRMEFAGDFRSTSADTILTLQLDTELDVRFKLGELVELYGVNLATTITFETPTGEFDPNVHFALDNIGVDGVKIVLPGFVSLTATNVSFAFQHGATHEQINADHPAVPDDRKVMAHLGTIGAHIKIPGLGEVGGSVSNLDILLNGQPDLLHTSGFELGGSSPFLEKVLQWVPLRIDRFGVEFHSGVFSSEGSLNVDNLFASTITVSGRVVNPCREDATPQDCPIPWPITGGFEGLKVQIGKIRSAFENNRPEDLLEAVDPASLKNVRVSFNPVGELFKDLPFEVSGTLGFGAVTVNEGAPDEKTAIYADIEGNFKFQEIGAGIRLVISDRGPLLATVSAPLGIPIGPTTLILSNVAGGLKFGGDGIPNVTDPKELLTNPVYFEVFDISPESIADQLKALIDENKTTWFSDFTMGLSGTIVTAAAPGIVSGEVTLTANIVIPKLLPNGQLELPTLKLLGTGELKVFGMPLGDAALLIDFRDPLDLAPQLDFAFSLPSARNPLAFLMPAEAQFMIHLDTRGIVKAPLVGVSAFLTGAADSIIDNLIEGIADRMRKNVSHPLRSLLFPQNFPADADLAARVEQRLLELLPEDFNTVLAMNNQELRNSLDVADALFQEFFAVADCTGPYFDSLFGISVDVTAPPCDGVSVDQLLVSLANAVNDGAENAAAEIARVFDPVLNVHGHLQPKLFGFPLGDPAAAVDLTISKKGLSFGADIDMIETMGYFTGLPTSLFSLGTELNLNAGVTLSFPDTITTFLVEGKIPSGFSVAADLLESVINPFAEWEVQLTGTAKVFGFPIGKVSGLLFPSQLDANNNVDVDPNSFFGRTVSDLPLGADGKPLDAASSVEGSCTENGDPNQPPRILLTPERYEDAARFGGLLISGQLCLPSFLMDPVGVLAQIDDSLPKNAQGQVEIPAVTDFVGIKSFVDTILNELGRSGVWTQAQLFIPSPAGLFNFENLGRGETLLRDVGSRQQIARISPANVQANDVFTLTLGSEHVSVTAADSNVSNVVAGLVAAWNAQPQAAFKAILAEDKSNHILLTSKRPGDAFRVLTSTRTGNNPDSQTLTAHVTQESILDGRATPPASFQIANGTFPTSPSEYIAFADLNGNSIYDPRIDVLVTRTGSGTAFTERVFSDTNGDLIFDTGTDIPIQLGPNPTPRLPNAFSYFRLNDIWFDRGNGLYDGSGTTNFCFSITGEDDGEGFVDVNANQRYDHGIDTLIDGNANGRPDGELFLDSIRNGCYDRGEKFIDLGNSLFEGSPFEHLDIGQLLRDFPQKVDHLIQAAFLEGFVNNKLLGIDLGNARISASPSNIEIHQTLPWLAGFEASIGAGVRQVQVIDLINQILDSPVATFLTDSPNGGQKTQLRNAINSANSPVKNLTFDLPVAGFEATVSANRLLRWLQDSFGLGTAVGDLPGQNNQNVVSVASALPIGGVTPHCVDDPLCVFVGAYTPGYGGPSDAWVKQQGGYQLEASFDIPFLVDDARFLFAVEMFSTSPVPDFVATAQADTIRLPGLDGNSSIMRLDNVALGLAKQDGIVTLDFDGDVAFFDNSATQQIDGLLEGHASGVLNADVDKQGSNDGYYGAVDLTIEAGAKLTIGSATLEGDFNLLINTTAVKRDIEITGENGVKITEELEPKSFRVFVDGKLQVGGIDLDGTFVVEVGSSGLSLAADAAFEFKVPNAAASNPNDTLTLASFTVNGGLFINRQGAAAKIDATLVNSFASGLGFELDGRFTLEMNTTGRQVEKIAGVTVDLSGGPAYFRVHVRGDNPNDAAHLTILDAFRLDGSFYLQLNTSGLLIEADVSIALGDYSSGMSAEGALIVNSSGLSGKLTVDQDQIGTPGRFSLDGDFEFQFDTGQQKALLAISDAELNILGLELSGSAEVRAQSGVFIVHVPESDPMTLEMWGAFHFEVFGEISPTTFDLHADAALQIGSTSELINLQGTASLDIGQASGFQVSFLGVVNTTSTTLGSVRADVTRHGCMQLTVNLPRMETVFGTLGGETDLYVDLNDLAKNFFDPNTCGSVGPALATVYVTASQFEAVEPPPGAETVIAFRVGASGLEYGDSRVIQLKRDFLEPNATIHDATYGTDYKLYGESLEASLTPTGDRSIGRSSSASIPSSGSALMLVKNAADNNQDAAARLLFDLSELPSSSFIANATLRLHYARVDPASTPGFFQGFDGRLRVYRRVTNASSWDNGAVDTGIAKNILIPMQPAGSDVELTLDVTSLIKYWLDTDPTQANTYGLELRASDGDHIYLSSRDETVEALRPKLEVTTYSNLLPESGFIALQGSDRIKRFALVIHGDHVDELMEHTELKITPKPGTPLPPDTLLTGQGFPFSIGLAPAGKPTGAIAFYRFDRIPASSAAGSSDLYAWTGLDDGAGGVIARLLEPGPFVHTAAQQRNDAIHFPGGSAPRITTKLLPLQESSLTAEAMFNLESLPTSGVATILRMGNNSSFEVSNGGQSIIVNSSGEVKLSFLKVNGQFELISLGNVIAGQWNHVALRWNGSAFAGSLNGVESAAKTGPFELTGRTLVLGERFNGDIDEVRLWNQVLTTQFKLNSRSISPASPHANKLLLYYRFDASASEMIEDLTGRNQHGSPNPSTPKPSLVMSTASIGYAAPVPVLNRGGLPEITTSYPAGAFTNSAAAVDWRAADTEPQVLGPNLLINGGFDLPIVSNGAGAPGRIQGWIGDNWRGAPDNGPGAYLGTSYLAGPEFKVGDSAAFDGRIELYQIVNVSQYSARIQLQQQKFVFNGYMRSLEESGLTRKNGAEINIEYLDSNDNVLSSFSSGVTAGTIWQQWTHEQLAPANTKKIKVRLLSDLGSEQKIKTKLRDSFFDGLSLQAVEAAKAFEFEVTLKSNNSPGCQVQKTCIPAQQVTITGIDFWDRAASGLTKWELRSSRDNFQSVLASGNTHLNAMGRNVSSFPPGLGCLRVADTPLTFRLSALGTSSTAEWRVDNVALLGSRGSPSGCPNAADLSFTTVQNTIKSIQLSTLISSSTNATHIDLDRITKPVHGSLHIGTNAANAPTGLIYTPPAGWSGTDTFTYTVVNGASIDTGTISINVSSAVMTVRGSYVNSNASGGLVFLDANRNGVLDFLDANGDGLQSDDEFAEPVSVTKSDGAFLLELPAPFDRNDNGQLDPADGRLVAEGGTVVLTGLTVEGPFTAPAGSQVITPLTTILSELTDRHGLTLAEAQSRIISVLGLPAVDLASFDPIAETIAGNLDAAKLYLASTKLQNALIAVNRLIHGLSEDALPAFDATIAFAAVADRIATGQQMEWSSSTEFRRLVEFATTHSGGAFDPEVVSATNAVLAEINSIFDSLSVRANGEFLEAVSRVKKVASGAIADDLTLMAAGLMTPEEFQIQYTSGALHAEVSSSQIGSFTAPQIAIDDVTLSEGTGVSNQAVFVVRLSHSSLLPVRVYYETIDGTAHSSARDYLSQSGWLTFQPGETLQHIVVPVLGDVSRELDELFTIQLSEPDNGTIVVDQATGTLTNDDLTVEVLGLTDQARVLVGDSLRLQLDLPPDDAGTLLIAWGDGFSEISTATSHQDAAMLFAEHRYSKAGEFNVVVSISDGTDSKVELQRFQVVVLSDTDHDGIADSVEDTAPHNGDGNNDGILDREQSHVASVRHSKNGSLVTLVTEPGASLFNVRFDDPPLATPHPDATLPFGFFEFGVFDLVDEATATVEVLIHQATLKPNAYFHLQTDGMSIINWQDFRYGVPDKRGAARSGSGFVLHLADGSGDSSSASDGIIYHAGAAAMDRTAFRNPVNRWDVNHDGSVVPLDVLRIVNVLNNKGSNELTELPFDNGQPFHFIDVNGDGFVTPNDALQVINFLNRRLDWAEGEKEHSSLGAGLVRERRFLTSNQSGAASYTFQNQDAFRPSSAPSSGNRIRNSAVDICFAESIGDQQPRESTASGNPEAHQAPRSDTETLDWLLAETDLRSL